MTGGLLQGTRVGQETDVARATLAMAENDRSEEQMISAIWPHRQVLLCGIEACNADALPDRQAAPIELCSMLIP